MLNKMFFSLNKFLAKDESEDSQLLLEAGSEPKKMNAKIDNDSNHKYLPSKKEK